MGRTDYDEFEASSVENRRLLRQEEFILSIAETFWKELKRQKVSRAELARRLGKTPGFVTQILSGDRNLTLRTVADISDALNMRLNVTLTREASRWPIA